MLAWNPEIMADKRSSRISSSIPSTPALKKTLVLPRRYSAGSSCRASRTFSETALPSTKPCGTALGAKMEYLKWSKKNVLIYLFSAYCKIDSFIVWWLNILMFDLIFVTSVWIQSRWLCWGILYDKFWYPQVHRYIGAGSGPGRHRSCRTVSFRWEWYNAQNEGECCTSSSSVCSRIPKTKQYKRLRLIISIHKIHITFRSV